MTRKDQVTTDWIETSPSIKSIQKIRAQFKNIIVLPNFALFF
jgi:hypothetical protein